MVIATTFPRARVLLAGALLAGFWIFRKATPQPPAMPEGPIAVTS